MLSSLWLCLHSSHPHWKPQTHRRPVPSQVHPYWAGAPAWGHGHLAPTRCSRASVSDHDSGHTDVTWETKHQGARPQGAACGDARHRPPPPTAYTPSPASQKGGVPAPHKAQGWMLGGASRHLPINCTSPSTVSEPSAFPLPAGPESSREAVRVGGRLTVGALASSAASFLGTPSRAQAGQAKQPSRASPRPRRTGSRGPEHTRALSRRESSLRSPRSVTAAASLGPWSEQWLP